MDLGRWLAALAAVLLLTGCAPSWQSGPRTTTTEPAPTVAPPTGTNPAPRDSLADSGLVRLPVAELPKSWNPYHPSGPQPSGPQPGFTSPLGPLLPAFVRFDSRGGAAINHDFLTAANWESPTTLVLTQNPEAKWADGRAISATDWVATWRALNGSDPAFQVRSTWGWSDIVGVAGRGPEITLTFAKPFPDWTWLLRHGPLRAESVATAQVFNNGWTKPETGWFAGPFTVANIDAKPGLITAIRNPHYPVAPRLDQVVFRVLEPAAAQTAWRLGELDVLDLGVDFAAAELAQTLEVTPRWGAAGSRTELRLNPNTLSQNVRQAVSSSLVPVVIFYEVCPGVPSFQPVNNLVFQAAQSGYSDSAVATGLLPDYGIARQLLAAEGWEFNSDWRKDGAPLVLNLAAGSPPTLAVAVREQLAAQGVVVREVASDDPAWQLRIESAQMSRFPTRNLASLPLPAAEIGDLDRRVAAESSPVRRADLLTQAAYSGWQAAVIRPLYQNQEATAVREKLANLGPFGLATGDWADVGWTR